MFFLYFHVYLHIYIIVKEFESLCRCLLTSLGQLQEEQQQLSMRIRSCIAGALISLSSLPGKFNPIIRPLMDCIKTDSDPLMKVISHLVSKYSEQLTNKVAKVGDGDIVINVILLYGWKYFARRKGFTTSSH